MVLLGMPASPGIVRRLHGDRVCGRKKKHIKMRSCGLGGWWLEGSVSRIGGPTGHVWVAAKLEIKECWSQRPTVKNVVLAEANSFEHSGTHLHS